MEGYTIFLQGLALGISAAASPGAYQSYLITQSLLGGWRRGALVAFSPLLSDPPIVIAILLLLDHLPDGFLQILSLLGGCFVLYLAWGFGKQWRETSSNEMGEQKSDPNSADSYQSSNGRAVLLRGALMNLLSPGPYTFWTLVLGPLLLDYLRASPTYGALFLLSFYSTLIGGMLLIAALFHHARRLGKRVVRSLLLISLIILTLFGMLLLWRGISLLTA